MSISARGNAYTKASFAIATTESLCAASVAFGFWPGELQEHRAYIARMPGKKIFFMLVSWCFKRLIDLPKKVRPILKGNEITPIYYIFNCKTPLIRNPPSYLNQTSTRVSRGNLFL